VVTFTLNTGFKEEHFLYDQHLYYNGRSKVYFSSNYVLGYAALLFQV